MIKTPKVIDYVVQNDLCIGCGLCVYKCPSNALETKLNDLGFFIPESNGNCDLDGDCLKVCPFNPIPAIEVKTENELADIFLIDSPKKEPKIGKYSSLYAGFSNEFRLTSSSGGIASFIFKKLLSSRYVDHIFSVQQSKDNKTHYEYSVVSTLDGILKSSKTRYYPVNLSSVFSEIENLDGKIAVVGVACFIKAIRLAQYSNSILKNKIPFLIGIICGGVKSEFFTQYLSEKTNIKTENLLNPKYRIKDFDSTAGDYAFGGTDKLDFTKKELKMSKVGDMWGTGMFKANACDFCDDVTTELADISLGDAWIPPYNLDGKGNSVIVARTKFAESIILDGIKTKELNVDELTTKDMLLSQRGSFNHRHGGLNYRVSKAKKKGRLVPPKRFDKDKATFDFEWVQFWRSIIRKKSLSIWKSKRNSILFDKKIQFYLYMLKTATRIYHHKKRIILKFNKK